MKRFVKGSFSQLPDDLERGCIPKTRIEAGKVLAEKLKWNALALVSIALGIAGIVVV